MKLYYTPGACPLSVHIALCELGLPYTLAKVDLKTKKLEDESDYTAINPKGYVPALQLDNGELLTEVPAILTWLADQKPEAGLLPAAGSLERARVVEWLSFTGTELHKSSSPLFRPDASADWKAAGRANLERRYGYANDILRNRDYLTGDQFTVADCYFFVVLSWTPKLGVDIGGWPAIQAYQARVAARPAVQKAMREQGLIS